MFAIRCCKQPYNLYIKVEFRIWGWRDVIVAPYTLLTHSLTGSVHDPKIQFRSALYSQHPAREEFHRRDGNTLRSAHSLEEKQRNFYNIFLHAHTGKKGVTVVGLAPLG